MHTGKNEIKLKRIFETLEAHFGDLRWWPAESDFEVIIGVILTQNTAWANVVKAVINLKQKHLLTADRILKAETEELARLIRPAGYYRLKALRLKEISRFIMAECCGDLRKLRGKNIGMLRNMLLRVNGVGPESADSILLYAFGKPVFVVDAYTKRIFLRHNLIFEDASYDDVQTLVHESFPLKARMLNQFHALLVETAKRFCKKKAGLCQTCPLSRILH